MPARLYTEELFKIPVSRALPHAFRPANFHKNLHFSASYYSFACICTQKQCARTSNAHTYTFWSKCAGETLGNLAPHTSSSLLAQLRASNRARPPALALPLPTRASSRTGQFLSYFKNPCFTDFLLYFTYLCCCCWAIHERV